MSSRLIRASGGGGVTSVTAGDGSITVSPNTGDVVLTNAGGTSYWIQNTGVDIYNTNIGGVGIGQQNPLAELHVSPLPEASAFTASLLGVATATGFPWGTNPGYGLYSEDSAVPVFTPGISVGFPEPPSSNYDPSGGSANFNTGESGYTASGYDFNYTIWALYPNGQIGYGSTTTGDTGSDPNDGSTYGVDVSGVSTPPAGDTGSYLVLCNGSNPNSGLYQVVSSPNFTDSGSGWGGSASYGPLLYQVLLGWNYAASPIDRYVVQNTTNNTNTVTTGNSAIDDNSSWTPGTATVSPVGQLHGIQNDGDFTSLSNIFNIGGVNYLWPISANPGVLQSDGGSPSNLSFSALSISSLTGATANQILYGSGSSPQQDPRLIFNGTNFVLGDGTGSGQQAGFAIWRYTDPSSSGTLNNYNTTLISNMTFAFPVTLTGFSGGVNGKRLMVWNTSGVTYKNNNSGSLASNRIITPNGGDYTPAATISNLVYDGTANLWYFENIDYPNINNTWGSAQALTITGVTNNSNAASGIVGEYINSNIPNSTHSPISISIANPAVVGWTAHGLNNVTPVVFATTGALPTGVTAGTVYWTCNVTTNSFNIATSIANAIAGTTITTSGTQSGTQSATSGMPLSTGSDASITALSLPHGDWDVTGNVTFTANALTTATLFTASIGTTDSSVGTSPNSGAFNQLPISIGAGGTEPTLPVSPIRITFSSTTKTVYLVANSTFATSTMTAYGFLRARRVR